MADVNRFLQSTQAVRLTGGDELYSADVILEDSVKKLLVQSSTIPDTLGSLLFTTAKLAGTGSDELAVNGGGTPQSFIINTLPVNDTFVRELIFKIYDGGIKVENFLGQNGELNGGILVSITSSGVTSVFNPIRTTGDFDANFSLGNGGKFSIVFASGGDFLSARFSPALPFKLVGGTSDNITVTVRDNISNVSSIKFQMFANEDI